MGCALKARCKLAGMDGNRTHPGRLSSAPQTVLKAAFLPSGNVRQRPRKMRSQQPASADVRWRLPTSDRMAVTLAVRSARPSPATRLAARQHGNGPAEG